MTEDTTLAADRLDGLNDLASKVQEMANIAGHQAMLIENLISSHEELVSLALKGVDMRAAQRAYFAKRTRDNLVASKVLESEFDKLAKAIVEKINAARAAVAEAAQAQETPPADAAPVSDLFDPAG